MRKSSFQALYGEAAQELLYNGVSTTEVAKRYGVCSSTVRRVTESPYWPSIEGRREDIEMLTKRGLTARAIAERLGLSERTVVRHRSIVRARNRRNPSEATPNGR